MGRLTLNVLLSFAQFEREVIGERVRDKIAASKKKGIWVGGPLPLGYTTKDKKVVIIPDEAKIVRAIFQRYLDLGSIGALAKDLDGQGIRTKRQLLSGGRVRGGVRYGTGAISHLLKNRFFIGEVVYHGENNRGDFEPIVSRELFDAVQTMLASKTAERTNSAKGSTAILIGRIYDDRGNRMTPSHSNKKGVRYRYYVSHPTLQNRGKEAGSVSRVSATEVENIVLQALRTHSKFQETFGKHVEASDREVIEALLDLVVITSNKLSITLRWPDSFGAAEKSEATETISTVWSPPNFSADKGVAHAPEAKATMSAETRDALLSAVAKARKWAFDLSGGRTTLANIAKREGKVERHIRLLVPLAFVSPNLIKTIIDGTAPAEMTVTGLAYALPYDWATQIEDFSSKIVA